MNPEDIHHGRGMLKWIARWNAWQRALARDRKMTEQMQKRQSKKP